MITTHTEKGWEWEGGREGGREGRRQEENKTICGMKLTTGLKMFFCSKKRSMVTVLCNFDF